MLRKSQASNAWAATFKNPDFSKSFLYKILAFFSYLLMLVPSSSVDMERLKYRNVELGGLFTVGHKY